MVIRRYGANNILFGQPYDKEKYNNIVRVCALTKDFQQFNYGDKLWSEIEARRLAAGNAQE